MVIDKEWLVATRRAFHRIPEYAFEEVKTSELIKKHLTEFGLGPIRSLGGTGVAVDVGTGKGPVLALRADMDALRIKEKETCHNCDYISQHEGMMHACGHDVHVTTVLGAARALALDESLRARLKGTVRFFFQPAEEIGGGAQKMVDDGLLENPPIDKLIALHVSPSLLTGHIGMTRGPAFAACDHFTITIQGIDGHGSQPHVVRDPIAAGAYLVTQLQTIISRSINPIDSGVISVCRFEAGKTFNVIPEKAILEGTVRTLNEETRDHIEGRLRKLVDTLPAIFDLPGATMDYSRDTPTGYNDPELVDEMKEIGGDLLGKDNVHLMAPSMGAEDFAFYTRDVTGKKREHAPLSCFIRLGVRNIDQNICWDGKDIIGIHNARFDVDETALEYGVKLYLSAIEKFLT